MNDQQKRYYCGECGYKFPKELMSRIEKGIQVYCEMCGYPFALEGVKFKEFKEKEQKVKGVKVKISDAESKKGEVEVVKESIKIKTTAPRERLPENTLVSLNNAIQDLNKFSYIILFIVSALALLNLIKLFYSAYSSEILRITFESIALFIFGNRIAHFDKKRIVPLIENKEYNKVGISAFCLGIMGCVVYGSGVVLLIKGILVNTYIANDERNKDYQAYDAGLLVKDSFNSISTYAGVTILILAFTYVVGAVESIMRNAITASSIGRVIVLGVIFIISTSGVLIDKMKSSEIASKTTFTHEDGGVILTAGIIGCLFGAAGIFILLKGALILILASEKPPEFIHYTADQAPAPQIVTIPPTPPKSPYEMGKDDGGIPTPLPPESDVGLISIPIQKEGIMAAKSPQDDKGLDEIPPTESSEKSEKETKMEVKEEKKIEKKEKKRRLKMHESLLPISKESDREVVEKYFLRIFSVLSEKIRRKIIELNIPEKDKKEILKEFAFLTEEEQEKYLNELFELNRELSEKLILRVKKLNLAPKYLQQIIEQLRYMPIREQEQYIKFLEEST